MQVLQKATQEQLDDLWYDSYGQYIMDNADSDYAAICNGDDLLHYMESNYLWEEFLASKGLTDA